MRNKSKIILFTIFIIMFILSSCKISKNLLVNVITKSETSEEIEYISNNKVLNKINKIVLEDSDGNAVDNDEIITGIFQSAKKIEHDIWEFQIFKILDNYFVLVKLNVNWQSPCDFYEYDENAKELKLLHRFQGIDIIGLSLPNKE